MTTIFLHNKALGITPTLDDFVAFGIASVCCEKKQEDYLVEIADGEKETPMFSAWLETRASCVLAKCSTTEPPPQLLLFLRGDLTMKLRVASNS